MTRTIAGNSLFHPTASYLEELQTNRLAWLFVLAGLLLSSRPCPCGTTCDRIYRLRAEIVGGDLLNKARGGRKHDALPATASGGIASHLGAAVLGRPRKNPCYVLAIV